MTTQTLPQPTLFELMPPASVPDYPTEPWSVHTQWSPGRRGKLEPETFIVSDRDAIAAMFFRVGGGFELDVEAAMANARRIVAAVNACAGISTEDLERLVVPSGRNGHAV